MAGRKKGERGGMNLQALTGSVAFAISQTAVALCMFGLFLAARRDRCTRYWAVASALSAAGLVLPFLLYGTRFSLTAIWIGSSVIVAGGVVMWWGHRLFFGRSVHPFGQWLILLHFLIVAGVFSFTDDVIYRVISFGVAMITGIALVLFEVWRGDGTRLTVARKMVIASYAIIPLSLLVRGVIIYLDGHQVTPLSNANFNVVLLYLVPLVGAMLGAVGTLLMYFERTIRDKDYLASHDELTNLYNRRAVTEQGIRILLDADRREEPVALLLVDIDHFKAVNDTLGHEAGDRALCAVANALANTCRRTDVIGRHGGEEFCIVCPNTDRRQATILANRLLKAVDDLDAGERLADGYSVSIGLASMDGAGRDPLDWNVMLQHADQALYEAKAAGRNRVVAV
jgi:diguanylate cyclase (GGDEF)-like protein